MTTKEVNEALFKLVKRHREWIRRNPDLLAVEDQDWAREADRVIPEAEALSLGRKEVKP